MKAKNQKKMKISICLAVVAVGIALAFSGCELDNYESADAVVKGSIVEEAANVPFQTQTPNGARVRFYENYNGVWSPQPYDVWVHQDGTFNNNAVFSGEYKIVPEGAFFPVDTQTVRISGTYEMTIRVTPYLHIDIETRAAAGSISATAKIRKAAGVSKIESIVFLISNTPYVDVNTWMEKGGEQSLTQVSDDEIVNTEYAFSFSGLDSGKTYYVRVGARARNDANAYNYSEIAAVTAN
jgi:hypothetical protein